MPGNKEADNERKKDMLVMIGRFGLWVAERHHPQPLKISEDYRLYLTAFILLLKCLNVDGREMAEWT